MYYTWVNRGSMSSFPQSGISIVVLLKHIQFVYFFFFNDDNYFTSYFLVAIYPVMYNRILNFERTLRCSDWRELWKCYTSHV